MSKAPSPEVAFPRGNGRASKKRFSGTKTRLKPLACALEERRHRELDGQDKRTRLWVVVNLKAKFRNE